MLVCLCVSTLSAWDCPQGLQSLAESVKDAEFDLGYTYRRDKLKWSIGSDDGPNILSELSWKNLYINQISAMGYLTTQDHFYLRGFADYGGIFHGTNQDSDFFGDNRTLEFSRSINKADKGEVFDLSAAIGREFDFLCNTLRLVPLVGYSWHEQHLRMMHGNQVLFTPNPALTGPIDNLHSSYKTRWFGPFVGADLFYDISCNWSLFGTVEYHSVLYRGTGHWNLRNDFLDDFHHKAHGQGFTGAVGAKYTECGNWNLSLIAAFQNWKTRKGSHSVLLDLDNDGIVLAGATLNPVHWRSATLTAAAGYSF